MPSTLLDIVQAAVAEVGGDFDVPTSAVGNADPGVVQMVALLNAAGRELVRAHDWSFLQNLWTLTTVQGQSDYPLPADFARIIEGTAWDRATQWPVGGGVSPQQDRAQRESQVAPAVLWRDYRLVGGALRLFPTPTDGGVAVVLEYVSNAWAVTTVTTGTVTSTVPAQRFTADSDTCLFDFDLMVKEAKWRWRNANRLDAQAERMDRDMALDQLIAADLAAPVLDMNGCDGDMGGDAFAGTDPSYLISTGSGPRIRVD